MLFKIFLRNIRRKIKFTFIFFKKNIRSKWYDNYNTDDIIAKLNDMGIEKGSVVFIHSSWDSFQNFEGTPVQLIKAIIKLIGPNGTLAMPAFPDQRNLNNQSFIFDVKKTPSAAGLLTELFRRFPDVKRSISINHSVCAWGKYADFLTKDHHLGETSWDEFSPYYRLKDLDAVIVGLGVGHHLKITTSLHCVESLLRKKIFYFSQLFKEKVTYNYIDIDGNKGVQTFLRRTPNSKIKTKKIAKYFSSTELKELKISDLSLYSISARCLILRSITLGERGVTMYTYPKPKKSLFYFFKQ